MFLGRVNGHIVATAKDPAIAGRKLLVVEPLKIAYDDPSAAANASSVAKAAQSAKGAKAEKQTSTDARGHGSFQPTGRAIVALDMIGAGEGQLVLIVQGSSARMAEGCEKTPTDAVVVGIVDETYVLGQTLGG